MKKYHIRLYCLCDNTVWNVKLNVPEDVTLEMVEAILSKSHEILDNEGIDETDVNYGRCESCEYYGNGTFCSDCVEGDSYICSTKARYEYDGRNPVTLLDYVCEKYEWSWELLKYDLDWDFI